MVSSTAGKIVQKSHILNNYDGNCQKKLLFNWF
jgi:hypothetical protein